MSRSRNGSLQIHEDYRKFLGFLRQLDLSHIPISLSPQKPLAPAWVGGPITAFDCAALYGIVHKYSPKLYLEIGSGMTTCFARRAIADGRLSTKVVSIDPEPRREVDAICDQVIREGLETCDVSLFDQLEDGDILFFDGSHRSFMNSDVTVFFIDVLPRIKPGVIVHVHDVLLPWDYPEFVQELVLERAIYAGCILDGVESDGLSAASHFMDLKISGVFRVF